MRHLIALGGSCRSDDRDATLEETGTGECRHTDPSPPSCASGGGAHAKPLLSRFPAKIK